jgi:hypothetical protein
MSALLVVGSLGCEFGFYCGPDRPAEGDAPAGPCHRSPEGSSHSHPPTDNEREAYATMPGPHPPSDYGFGSPSSIQLDGKGAVVGVEYRSEDGKTVLGRGDDTNRDGLVDTYTRYEGGKARSQTRDSDGNGTLDTRLEDKDGDGKPDVRSAYPPPH